MLQRIDAGELLDGFNKLLAKKFTNKSPEKTFESPAKKKEKSGSKKREMSKSGTKPAEDDSISITKEEVSRTGQRPKEEVSRTG